MNKKCPMCGGTEFITKAHVIQEWLVNECELCKKVINDFADISKDVSDDNIWECYKCGYRAKGHKFNTEE